MIEQLQQLDCVITRGYDKINNLEYEEVDSRDYKIIEIIKKINEIITKINK